MTEKNGKKYGYVVDLNPSRNLHALIDINNGNDSKIKNNI